MIDLMHSVADLIDERDREGLEVTLARVAFELAGARALTFWRVFRRSDGVWLRKRVTLPPTAAGCEPQEDDAPIGEAGSPLKLAFELKTLVRWRDRASRRNGCVLPVPSEAEPVALVDIELACELDRERIALLKGVLRIYRGHLAALDYGDIDELTRLANRRTFDDQFSRLALAEARRNGGKRFGDVWGARAHLGVADIDFFKQVNDRFGHPYGDEVLVLFADIMRSAFRDSDKLFRFGGEEFITLISNCDIEDALAAFERFRAAVAAYRFPQIGEVTVSIGVTSVHLHDTGSAAFGRADQALYVAKRRGRNRVLLFEALQESPALESIMAPTPEVEWF
ncbi:MAG TPA: GGDEF domain-containing protein [Roseiarcus sp.]|nr:GGDEF domain-containing protein [Roseiarcus sp.]